jgi:RNA polymerase sigma factor (sigma-70 family)
MHQPRVAAKEMLLGVPPSGWVVCVNRGERGWFVPDFEAWVQARSPQLARAAYLLAGDAHLAEDLLQDTLARVASRWESLTRTGSVDPYARKVMYHLSVDWWRRRRIRPELVLGRPPELLGPADGEGSMVRRLMLREALMRLTARQRAVLVVGEAGIPPGQPGARRASPTWVSVSSAWLTVRVTTAGTLGGPHSPVTDRGLSTGPGRRESSASTPIGHSV